MLKSRCNRSHSEYGIEALPRIAYSEGLSEAGVDIEIATPSLI